MTVVKFGDMAARRMPGSGAGKGRVEGCSPQKGAGSECCRGRPVSTADSSVSDLRGGMGETALCVLGCARVGIFQVGAGTWGGCEPTRDQQAKEEKQVASKSHRAAFSLETRSVS